jgi:rhodanese-related sulfurtransferase
MNRSKLTKSSIAFFIMLLNVHWSTHVEENKNVLFTDDSYQCMPCGLDCDKEVYTAPGKCKHCQMELVKKSTVHFKTIQSADVCKYLQSHPAVVLLDVRTKEEFEGKSDPDFGTLKNAINVPVQLLESRLADLESYKDKEIIVYCSHSHRSPRASYILTQHGFSNVTNMAGGMSEMKNSDCKK